MTAIARTSPSSSSTARTRSSGASGSANTRGSFRKAASIPARRPSRRCTGSCARKSGSSPQHVRILGRTRDWLRYEVPQHWIKREWRGSYRGQKQIWYLLRLTGRDNDVSLRATDHPEFDAWRWHDYWVPLENVIDFKREVYRRALIELERFLHARPQTRRERLYGFPHPMMPASLCSLYRGAREIDAQ